MSKLHRISPPEKAGTLIDVIFVHGLDGHYTDTWSIKDNENSFWPQWLDSVLPLAIVYSVEYEASASAWLGHAMPIVDQATNLLACLDTDGIGRRPIVFIAHSMGGLLTKQLLRNAEGYDYAPDHGAKKILAQSKGILFLSTPHQGSHVEEYLLGLQAVFRLTDAAEELKANASCLRDLNNWYRGATQKFAISTEVFCEARPTQITPFKSIMVVDQDSSDPGLSGVVATPVQADHFSICKPTDRDELVFKSCVAFVNKFTAPVLTAALPMKPDVAKFSDLSSLADVIAALDNLFSFRWELSSFNLDKKEPLVYWPVRLRHPTPIHAAQCFAASALQQRGARIHLFVDDLGEKNFPVDAFIAQFKKWIDLSGGNSQELNNSIFSVVIPPVDSGSRDTARPWLTVRKWLGDTEDRLETILTLSKLISASGETTLAELVGKRPRRLLTPALVWSCLEYLHSKFSDQQIITLGGHDERNLWDAWRERAAFPGACVGHLYAPQLNKFDNQHGSVAFHMAGNSAYSLEWNAKDDIRTALQTEFGAETNWFEPGRLVPWCLKGCVLLPRYLKDESLTLAAGGVDISLDTNLGQINQANLSPVLVDELAKWLM